MQRCVTWKYRQAHLDADLDPQSQAAASGAKLVFRPRLRIPRSVLDSVGKHGVVCHSLSTHTHTQFLFADNTQSSIWIPDFSPELVCISTCTSHTPNKLRDGTRPFLHLSLLLQVRGLPAASSGSQTGVFERPRPDPHSPSFTKCSLSTVSEAV